MGDGDKTRENEAWTVRHGRTSARPQGQRWGGRGRAGRGVRRCVWGRVAEWQVVARAGLGGCLRRVSGMWYVRAGVGAGKERIVLGRNGTDGAGRFPECMGGRTRQGATKICGSMAPLGGRSWHSALPCRTPPREPRSGHPGGNCDRVGGSAIVADPGPPLGDRAAAGARWGARRAQMGVCGPPTPPSATARASRSQTRAGHGALAARRRESGLRSASLASTCPASARSWERSQRLPASDPSVARGAALFSSLLPLLASLLHRQ